MITKNTHFEKRSYIPIFLVMFGLIFARYCYYGFEYFYQLDDYIQYHNFTAYNNNLWALIVKNGMLSARPLAGLCDLFVWSHFYKLMIVAVGIISAMYAAAAVFLHRVFSKHFGTGYLFFVIFALMPLGFEGTYWVSASSRIVVGLFFASASLLFFDKWCDDGKKRNLVLFAAVQFVSFCFYEQIILFSGAATLVIMLCNTKKPRNTRARFGLLMFINAALYFAITKLAPSGIYNERAVLFLPWQEDYGKFIFYPLLAQIKAVFLGGSGGTLGKGLVRGFNLLISDPNAVYVIFILAACAALFFISKNMKRQNISFFSEFFTGAFLAIIPVIIFFVIKNPWFGLRNAMPSFCGLALMGDALFDLVFGRFKRGYIAEAALVSILALLCCVASVSEIHDYRETTIADTAIASAAVEAIESSGISYDDDIWLLNVNPSYVKDGNLYFHEHDNGVTSSSWAMTGAIEAISGTNDSSLIPDAVPISTANPYEVEKSKVGASMSLWYTGKSFVPVSITKTGSDTWKITEKSGEQLGTLENLYGMIYLKIK